MKDKITAPQTTTVQVTFDRRAKESKNYAVCEIPFDRENPETEKVKGTVYVPKKLADGLVSATIILNYKK